MSEFINAIESTLVGKRVNQLISASVSIKKDYYSELNVYRIEAKLGFVQGCYEQELPEVIKNAKEYFTHIVYKDFIIKLFELEKEIYSGNREKCLELVKSLKTEIE
jgi:hypothetical protein